MQAPVFLLWGELDPWITPRSADKIQRMLPSVERVDVRGGHCPHDDVPELFLPPLQQWLKKLPAWLAWLQVWARLQFILYETVPTTPHFCRGPKVEWLMLWVGQWHLPYLLEPIVIVPPILASSLSIRTLLLYVHSVNTLCQHCYCIHKNTGDKSRTVKRGRWRSDVFLGVPEVLVESSHLHELFSLSLAVRLDESNSAAILHVADHEKATMLKPSLWL